jgi:hypothetical protein
MVNALLLLAAQEAEHSKTAFYLCGGALAAWAVILGLLGLRSPDFPGGMSGQRGVIAVSLVLVVATMATAVITA